MKLWDGYDRHRNERTRYDTANDAHFIYYIDEGGTVYYTRKETPDAPLLVWCPASMLTSHLMHLWQIRNR